jgi:hypothetical protein
MSNVVDFVEYKKFKEETLRQIEEEENNRNRFRNMSNAELVGLLKFLNELDEGNNLEYSINVEDGYQYYDFDTATYTLDLSTDED